MPIFASSTILPGLDDVRAHLNDTSTVNDAELQGFLNAAVGLIEQYVGPIEPQTVTETHYTVPAGRDIYLRQWPVLDSGTAVSTTGGSYVVDPAAGMLRAASVWYGVGYAGYYGTGYSDVTVTYTVGRTVLPDPLRMAILELVRDMWSGTQSGGAGAARYGQDVQEPVASSGRPPLPPWVEGVLEPYRLAPRVP